MKKKQLWKRVVAVGLATALILSTGMLGGKQGNVAKAETTNLVTNGDFDSDESAKDVTGWTPGEPEVEKEYQISDIMSDGEFNKTLSWSELSNYKDNGERVVDKAALKLTLSTTDNATKYTVVKSSIPAKAGVEYTISYDVKIASRYQGTKIYAELVERGGTTSTISGQTVTPTADNAWQTITFKADGSAVEAKADVTSWDLRIQVQGAGAVVYIDNVKITYPVMEDIMPDGAFDGTLSWSELSNYADNGERVVDEAALKLTLSTTDDSAKYMVYKNNIPAKAGIEYTISYDVKVASEYQGVKVYAEVVERGGTAQVVKGQEITPTADNTWQTITFKADGSAVQAKTDVTSWDLRIQVQGAGAIVYVDNVTITYLMTQDMIQEVLAGIVNGNFENGMSSWYNRGEEKTAVVEYEEENEDDHILRVRADGMSTMQTITVKPSTSYRITYLTKTELATGEGTVGTRLRLQQKKNDGTNYSYETPSTTNTSGLSVWTSMEYEFTTNSDVSGLEVAFLATGVNDVDGGNLGYAYFDDVKVVEIAPVYGDGVTLNGDNYAMKLSENNSATYDGASLVANTWYRFSYNVSADDNVTSAGFKVGDTIKTSTSGVFQYVEGQTIGFATEGTGVAYFDNLVIEPLSITMQANATYIMTVAQTLTGEGTVAPVVQNDTMTADVQAITTDTSKYVITPNGEGIYTISFTIGDGVTIDNATSILNRGDFDFDGELEEAEFTAIRKELVGVTDTGFDSQMMDLDADSKNTVKDLVRMKLYGAGLK